MDPETANALGDAFDEYEAPVDRRKVPKRGAKGKRKIYTGTDAEDMAALQTIEEEPTFDDYNSDDEFGGYGQEELDTDMSEDGDESANLLEGSDDEILDPDDDVSRATAAIESTVNTTVILHRIGENATTDHDFVVAYDGEIHNATIPMSEACDAYPSEIACLYNPKNNEALHAIAFRSLTRITYRELSKTQEQSVIRKGLLAKGYKKPDYNALVAEQQRLNAMSDVDTVNASVIDKFSKVFRMCAVGPIRRHAFIVSTRFVTERLDAEKKKMHTKPKNAKSTEYVFSDDDELIGSAPVVHTPVLQITKGRNASTVATKQSTLQKHAKNMISTLKARTDKNPVPGGRAPLPAHRRPHVIPSKPKQAVSPRPEAAPRKEDTPPKRKRPPQEVPTERVAKQATPDEADGYVFFVKKANSSQFFKLLEQL